MKTFAVAALAVLLPSAALAQAAQGFPFGLDALHWKIGKADAVAAFAPLRTPGRATASDPLTDQESLIVSSYEWKSCNFRIVFYFAKDALSTFSLEAKSGQQGCSDAALTELTAHYGAGVNDAASFDSGHHAFRTPETKAVYNGLYDGRVFEVTLMQNGGPPLLIAD